MIKIFDEKDTANVFDRPLCDTSEYEKTRSPPRKWTRRKNLSTLS